MLRASVRRVPLAGESQTVCAPEGASLADLVAVAFPDAFVRRFVVAFVDGVEVAPDAWGELKPSEGSLINLCVRPGGGEDGNKVLRTVLQIAVIAAAAWVGGIVGAQWGWAASTAVSIGGNLLINSLVPLTPLKAQGQNPDPFYTVTGARNQARIYQPVSLVLGKHRFFPPLYGRYVQETVGNDVYLRVPFCLGPAPMAVSQLKIGDTLLSAFSGVEVEQRLTTAAAAHTLYTGDPEQDVVGAKLTTTYQLRNTALDADEIEVVVGFRGGLGGLDSKNRKTSKTVSIEIRYRPSGSAEAFQTYRPSVPQANTASAAAGFQFRPGYFLTAPSMAAYAAQLAAQGGVPAGAVAIARADPGRPFQFPIRFAVPRHPAGYEVEVRRTTAEITDPANGVDSVWWELLGSLKSFVDPFPEAGLASIVLRIKASEQLSGVIDTFNVVAEPIVPLFSSAAKTTPATATAASLTTTGVSRNPAEIVLNLYRGQQAMRPRANDRIDWPAWAAFAAFCEAKGLHYDEVIEANIGRGELARRICAAAFARPMKWAGKLSVVIDRDRGAEAPAQVFTPRNVSNLRWRKAFASDVHAVRIAFNNADNGWQADETTLYLDGYSASNATKIETLPVAGKTDADEVRVVGRQFINNSLRQTETFSFDMDAEALTCRPGAYAVLLHDAISVGLGAHRVLSVATSAGNVTSFILDAAIPTEAADTHAARWRKEDGAGGFTVATEASVTRDAANPARFVFGTPQLIATAPAVGDVVLIGRATEVSLPVLVRDIAPDYGHRASITCVPYAPERFTPDGSPLPPHDPKVQLPIGGRPAAPVLIATTANSKEIVVAFVQPKSPLGISLTGFETAVREVGTSSDSWQDRGPLPADARVFVAPPGNPGYSYDLRVVAVGRDSGGLPVKSDPLIVSGVAAATTPAAPAGCSASFATRTSAAGASQLVLTANWTAVEDPDVLDTRVEMLVSTGPDVWAEIGQARAILGRVEVHGLQVGRSYTLGFVHLSRRGIASTRTTISAISASDTLVATGIRPGGVDLTAFASSIRPVELVSSNPSTGNTVGRTVYNTTDGKMYQYGSGGTWAEVAGGIADGSLTLAKFASSIRPVEIVASLPVSGNAEGRTVYLTTDDKLYRYTGSVWTTGQAAVDITGQLADVQIAALAASKVTGQLTNAQLADIAAAKVTGQLINAQLADIAAAKVTGQLTNAQLADIAATKITGTIATTQITDNAITTAKINAGAITTTKIAADAVTANEIAANAVTAVKIVAGAVTTTKLAALAVTANEIAASAVTAGKIAADAVTANEIAANAVTAVKINAGAITTPKLDAGAVTTAKLAALAVTANEIAANAVTAGKVAAGAISATELQAGSVVAGKIAAAAVSTTELAANAVTAAKIGAGEVTTTKLAAGAVTANELAANAIIAGKIAAGAVSTAELAAGAVTAAKMSVASLDAITATIGLLRTATTGQRMEIESNQGRVYDSAGVLRVRWGVWT